MESKEEKLELDFVTVMTLLRDHGIMYTGCFYQGGGDSGGTENYMFYGLDFKEKFDAKEIDLGWGEEGDMEFEHPQKKEILEFLDEMYMRQLNNVEDWWNNDGGHGTLMMDTETGKWVNINKTYRTETDTFNHSGQFQGE